MTFRNMIMHAIYEAKVALLAGWKKVIITVSLHSSSILFFA